MTSWFVLTLLAALFLGLYDVAKKQAVTDNAVPPVLLLNVMTAAIVWGGPVAYECTTGLPLFSEVSLTRIGFTEHVCLFVKSVIVGSSWMFAFFAIKHLPISIASPIRATSPLWTIILAVTLMAERPSRHQWLGMGLVLTAFYVFSVIGTKEGIQFRRNRYVWLMVVATLIAAVSGVYDKFLLQTMKLKPAIVQAWFSIYLVPVMFPMWLFWWFRDRNSQDFEFRWSIPLIAVFLLLADYTYFVAVSQPEALISIVSALRRTSIVIAFFYGILFLKEVNWRPKLICLFVLGLGIYMISI